MTSLQERTLETPSRTSLREVQGRRGITDFLVVCDETNNTGEVIDRNEFIAEIFVKAQEVSTLSHYLSLQNWCLF